MTIEEESVTPWKTENGYPQRFDWFIPELDLAIEYNGEQHCMPIDLAGKGEEWARAKFEVQKKRDSFKRKMCEKHKIKLIEIRYDELDIRGLIETIKLCEKQ